MNRIIRNYASGSMRMFITADNWSTANCRQTTVNRSYSTLCLYNYNWRWTVVRQLLTKIRLRRNPIQDNPLIQLRLGSDDQLLSLLNLIMLIDRFDVSRPPHPPVVQALQISDTEQLV